MFNLFLFVKFYIQNSKLFLLFSLLSLQNFENKKQNERWHIFVKKMDACDFISLQLDA